MRTFSILFFVAIILLSKSHYLHGQAPVWDWGQTAGSSEKDYAGGVSGSSSAIVTDDLGNSYVTGSCKGTAVFGTVTVNTGQHSAIFVAKYDTHGHCVWAKYFGGNDGDFYGNEGRAVAIDASGNCYVTGSFNGKAGYTINFASSLLTCTGARQIFVAKYDASGNEVWAIQPSSTAGTNHYANCIVSDGSGNSFITGYLGGGVNSFGSISLSGPGAYVFKFNNTGQAMWAVKIGNGNADASSLAIDMQGNSFVTGYLQNSDYFNTNPATTLSSSGARDVFVAKVGSAGSLDWVTHFTGGSQGHDASYSYGKGISSDASGNIYLTGSFEEKIILGSTTLTATLNQGAEAFITKLDHSGNPVWARQSISGAYGNTEGTAVKATASGYCYFTGCYYPQSSGAETFCGFTFPANGNQVTYIIKADPSGNGLWSEFSSGDGSSVRPAGISLDAMENVFVAGAHWGTQVFGTSTITGQGVMDILIAKLNNPQPVTGIAKNLKNEELHVGPIPFKHQVNFSLAGKWQEGSTTLTIFDLQGKIVYEVTVNSQDKITVQRGGLDAGVYLYRIKHGKDVAAGRLIVE